MYSEKYSAVLPPNIELIDKFGSTHSIPHNKKKESLSMKINNGVLPVFLKWRV
jgi:hypothetical protein